MTFCNRVRAGVADVNLGTFGSEPHMAFGGMSGDGGKEAGIGALDADTELKNFSVLLGENSA